MARNPSAQQKSKKAAAKSSVRTSRSNVKQAQRNISTPDERRLFDARARRDISGVACVFLSVVLFVTVALPSDAVVTSFVSDALHVLLGLGAYLLPVLLLIIGVSFLLRFKRERVPARIALGLTMIFVAVLALLALFTPETHRLGFDYLFNEVQLTVRGGYLGAGIAWVGLSLFGRVISCIILVGIIIAGLIVIGFSISKVLEHIQDARVEAEGARGVLPAPPVFSRSARSRRLCNSSPEEELEQEETRVIARPDQAPTRRLRRSSGTFSDDGFSEEADEEPRMLTRKLGKVRDKETPSSAKTALMSAKPETTTPLAAPSPDDGFELPSMSLLAMSKNPSKDVASNAELKETAGRLQTTLEDFGIMAEVVGWVAGPTVTLFKVDLPAGVRVSRITALEDDIALALAAPGVRIFAPIPGTNYVGIEVPNRTRQTVLLGDVIKQAGPGPLQIAIGKDVEGHAIISDLSKMPHLLIGGTTGSGKSVSINAMIMSILMRATPSEVRFIMIDPKRVEFTPYNGIPHLYVPVVTEPREAASALSWGVAEMERRLKVFSKAGARNIGQYNAKVQAEITAQKAAIEAGEEPSAGELGAELPYIVIIIDELADLMMNVGKEVEFSISRIAQLARAAGIHLIVATQRPSTNVVTGLIKANITNRIAFNVASGIDSRVVLDTPGAENLIGLGDLLLSKPELAKPQRIQGCYVSEDEIAAVVEMLKAQGEPDYHSEILQTNLITLGASQPDGSGGSSMGDDPLLWEAADIVVSSGLGSTSNIQRRLKVGYSRAGRIMDMLEEKGIVGPPNGSKPREVLVDPMELETLKAFEANDALNSEE